MLNLKVKNMRKRGLSLPLLLSVFLMIVPIVYAAVTSVPTNEMNFVCYSGSDWDFSGTYKAGWTSGTALLSLYKGKANCPDITINDGDETLKLRVDHWDSYGNCDYKIYWEYVYPTGIRSTRRESSTMDSWISETIPYLHDITHPEYVDVWIEFSYWSVGYSEGSNGFELYRYEVL